MHELSIANKCNDEGHSSEEPAFNQRLIRVFSVSVFFPVFFRLGPKSILPPIWESWVSSQYYFIPCTFHRLFVESSVCLGRGYIK